MYGRHAAVASGHHLATQQAKTCLDAGGSLIDAMVCASAVLAVALPHASSLGGCGMLLYFDARSGCVHALNGTGRAPLAAVPEEFAQGMPQRGPKAAVVPTLVRMWARAHERFGRMPWKDLLMPAVALAGTGMATAEELARNLAQADSSRTIQPGFADLFMPNGHRLAPGEMLVQKPLARVLETIALEGESGFYEGVAARSLVQFSQDNGGLFADEDFALSQADWVAPWATSIGQTQVHVMPPNSVGVLMLRQLERWQQAGRPAGAEGVTQAIESAIAVIAEGRERIGDIERTPVTPNDFGLGHAQVSDQAMSAFRAARAGVGDTTGFVAMDAAGNALAMLQSVFQPFGSGAVDTQTGILLNNRMFDFTPRSGGVNAVGPARRSSHTLNPWLMLEAGQARVAGVSPGGVSQTTTGFQIATGVLEGTATLGQLVARPRWSLARDGEVLLEPGAPSGVAQSLRTLGLDVQENSSHEFYFGSVKAVRRLPDGTIETAADNRRQAAALAW